MRAVGCSSPGHGNAGRGDLPGHDDGRAGRSAPSPWWTGSPCAGLQGSGAGSLALTGAGSTLVWGSTQALDNATLSIGSGGTFYGGHVDTRAEPGRGRFGLCHVPTVLLGSHLHIVQSGLYADIGGTYDGMFSSAATLTANLAHGQFLLQGTNFTNTGTIGVSGTDTLADRL